MQRLHRILSPARPFIADNLCALAVMTKAPRPGQVKTRLVPPLTPEQAAELNVVFLRDTAQAITKGCGPNARGVGVYTPVGSENTYIDILPQNFDLLPQRGDGFGERLTLAAADLFQCGFSSVCLIDSDSPTVPSEAYTQAVELLSAAGDRVVLGPSHDGGYYLIGMKREHAQLFERIDWSTERVLEQTKQRAQELGLEVKLLPAGYDVDDSASLQRLRDELLSNASPPDLAPHTRNFLTKLAAQAQLAT